MASSSAVTAGLLTWGDDLPVTDEMRVALMALAVASGLSVEKAWDVVIDLPGAPINDLRALVLEVAHRSSATVWAQALTPPD